MSFDYDSYDREGKSVHTDTDEGRVANDCLVFLNCLKVLDLPLNEENLDTIQSGIENDGIDLYNELRNSL